MSGLAGPRDVGDPRDASRFPDPLDAPADEPLAWGGDYDPALLLDAYRHGIFPWPTQGVLLWWSPDPRALFPLDGVTVSRSLRRTLRSGRFHCTTDQVFEAVVHACAHRPGEGSWIVPSLVEGYLRLHAAGHAHSVEVWNADGRLVGGAFGITVGACFTGESMFHRESDASKVALVHLAGHLAERGFTLLDGQLPTPHLTAMGAVAVPRRTFLARLAVARSVPCAF